VAPQTPKKFFKSLLVTILLLAIYSKMLGLPYALAIATASDGNIERGSLMVLVPPDNERSVGFECYDMLNSACKIGNSQIKAPTEYSILITLPQIFTVLLVVGGLIIIKLVVRDRFLLVVALALYVNGAVAGLGYIDQNPIVYAYKPLDNIEKSVDSKALSVTYKIVGDLDVVNASCKSGEYMLPVEVDSKSVTVQIPRELLLEKMVSMKLPPYVSAVPIDITVGYVCDVRLVAGVVTIKDTVTVHFEKLRIFTLNNTIVVYNGNPVEFNVTIILMYENKGITKQEVTIEPHTAYTLAIDPDAGNVRVYVEYEYFGKLVRERAWPPK